MTSSSCSFLTGIIELHPQRRKDIARGVFNGLVAFDQLQNAELRIEILQGFGLRVEDAESVLDGCGRVVLAEDKLFAAQIADTFLLRCPDRGVAAVSVAIRFDFLLLSAVAQPLAALLPYGCGTPLAGAALPIL